MRVKYNIVFLIVFLDLCLFIYCTRRRVKRVIGGFEVECGILPNAASLRNSSSLEHKCGVTIISTHFAVTAAHCVTSKEQDYIVQLNNYCHEINVTLPKINVEEIITHDSYDPVTRAHDLALIRLTLPDDITAMKRNLLPTSSFGISGECTMYGYGYKNLHTKQYSETLLAGSLKIVSLDECKSALGTVAPKYSDGMICAVGDGIDSCQGDSGSPLICAGGSVEGISSYGMGCAVPGLPGVYTSIGPHSKWIRDIIKDDDFSDENEKKL